MEFVKQFVDDVCLKLAHSIMHGFEKNNVSHNHEISEALYHQNFVVQRTSSFVGKEQQIAHVSNNIFCIFFVIIKLYIDTSKIGNLLSDKTDNHSPIVIFGNSGSGKTSLVAQIVKEARSLTKTPNLVIVYRFIGITPVSSSIFMFIKF